MEEANMKRGKRIVVAVDESKESMYALSWCLIHFFSQNTNNNTLILLYVKPPPPIYSSYDAAEYMFSKDAIKEIEKYRTDLVRKVMDRSEAVYTNFRTYNNHINVERIVGSGEAKGVICQTVEKLKADTLVMGSHGYGFLKRAILGSVSDYCAKHVKCPVVIVKHPDDQN